MSISPSRKFEVAGVTAWVEADANMFMRAVSTTPSRHVSLTPSQARQVADQLIALADTADRLDGEPVDIAGVMAEPIEAVVADRRYEFDDVEVYAVAGIVHFKAICPISGTDPSEVIPEGVRQLAKYLRALADLAEV